MPRWLPGFLFILPLVWVFSPVAVPIAMGAVFAITLYPVLELLERKKVPVVAGAILLSLGTFLLVLVPAGFLMYAGAERGFELLSQLRDNSATSPAVAEGAGLQQWIQAWVSGSFFSPWRDTFTKWFSVDLAQITEWIARGAGTVAIFLADQARKLLVGLPSLILSFVILALCLFAFLLQGKSIVWFLSRRIPFQPEFTKRLFITTRVLCRAVIVAMVLSGLVQAAFYSLIVLIVGGGDPILIGLTVFLASLIPIIGSAPATFGVAIFHLLSGHATIGITLAVAAAVTASLDNFVRPWVLSGEGKLHPVAAFLAAIGGLQAMGVAGIFLGPILAGVCLEALASLPQSE